MSNSFKEALKTGKVIVRKWWYNEDSTKDQVTVLFQQEVEKPNSEGSSKLLAASQGASYKQAVTALWSFRAEVAQDRLGSTEGNFVDEETIPVTGNEMFNLIEDDVNIEVVENFTKNPYRKMHEPKMNVHTGEIVTALSSSTVPVSTTNRRVGNAVSLSKEEKEDSILRGIVRK